MQLQQFKLDSPKAWVKHGHPRPSISGAAEQEVLPDGHVTDEWEDEEHHAEHDESQRAGYTHHSAPLPDDALNSRAGCGCSGQQDAPRRAQAPDANTPRTPDRFQRSSAEVEDLRLRDGHQPGATDRGVKPRPWRWQRPWFVAQRTEMKERRSPSVTHWLSTQSVGRWGDGGRGCLCRHAAQFITCKMLRFSCGVLKKVVASLSSCLLINKPGASQSADSALLFGEEIPQQQQ